MKLQIQFQYHFIQFAAHWVSVCGVGNRLVQHERVHYVHFDITVPKSCIHCVPDVRLCTQSTMAQKQNCVNDDNKFENQLKRNRIKEKNNKMEFP